MCNYLEAIEFIHLIGADVSMGRRQVVRQRVLVPPFLGSNPSGPVFPTLYWPLNHFLSLTLMASLLMESTNTGGVLAKHV